jgi:hypothetical protein
MRRALLLMLVLSLLQGALAYAALGSSPSDFGTTPVRQGGRSLAAASSDTAAARHRLCRQLERPNLA